jgi:methionine-rich copper-binding protein CopC
MRRTALRMAFLVLSLHGALAAPKRMVESFPAAQAVVDGRNAQYSVRFDGLVDHRASRLLITQGSRVVETLKPLLSAAPEVLFASAPLLPPGDYELHWSARSMADDGVTEGSIPFTVRR